MMTASLLFELRYVQSLHAQMCLFLHAMQCPIYTCLPYGLFFYYYIHNALLAVIIIMDVGM